MSSSTGELASLSLARAYIDRVQERVGSLGARELIDALDRVDRAYQEFPELALERPRLSLASLAMSLLAEIVREPLSPPGQRAELSPAAEVSSLMRWSREFRWDALEPVLSVLRRQGRADTILEITSAVLDRVAFIGEESTAGFGELLKDLLADEHPLDIDSGALVGLLRSARYRMKSPAPGRQQPGANDALLNLAARLRAPPPPAPPQPHPERAWPSGGLSFDEFLLQWPCEIELPADLDGEALIDEAFVDEAYRAILLRAPAIAERGQYLKLLRDGAVSREWIIEDLLASRELHSLDRRLRVVYGGRVITEPGSSGQDEMPVVTWPAPG
jgi:hypothetical protein